jgi:dTDP-4-dehydrorhamnose reductase
MSFSGITASLKSQMQDHLDLQNHPILVIGKDGQVGKSLQKLFNEFHLPVVFVGRAECDLADEGAIIGLLNHYQPQIIINASAYTAVDLAQTEEANAYQINAKAVELMAKYVATVSKGVFVHYSTDYVFDGNKETPYLEEDTTNPLGIYGKSKLAGEQAVQKAFENNPVLEEEAGGSPRYYIFRTSWVYGEGKNFIRTMLGLASQREELKVIQDQRGCPTSSDWLAQIAMQFVFSKTPSGIYHAVVNGEISWHGLALFAIETARLAGEGILVKSENILPIPATAYPLPAPRPQNSRMSNQKLKDALKAMPFSSDYPHWEAQVETYVVNYVKEKLRS